MTEASLDIGVFATSMSSLGEQLGDIAPGSSALLQALHQLDLMGCVLMGLGVFAAADRRYRRLAAPRRRRGGEPPRAPPPGGSTWETMKAKFLVPLLLFFGLAGFAFGLTLNPRGASPLIDKPAPNFRSPVSTSPEQTFALAEMRGESGCSTWASWCVACRQEHRCWCAGKAEAGAGGRPQLQGSARRRRSPAPAAWRSGRDRDGDRARTRRWLADHGNPTSSRCSTSTAAVGIDFGVYGVRRPSDRPRGRIRYKHIGPITRSRSRPRSCPRSRRLRRARLIPVRPVLLPACVACSARRARGVGGLRAPRRHGRRRSGHHVRRNRHRERPGRRPGRRR